MPPSSHRVQEPTSCATVGQRTGAVGRIPGGVLSASPEQVRAVLEARARELARPLAVAAAEEALETVTFAAAGETYAVESSFVVGVFRPVHVAMVPGAEGPVVGVTAWRGELLPLFDVARLLDSSHASADEPDPVVVVLGEDRAAFGLRVAAVGEVVRIPVAEVRHVGAGHGPREHLLGITSQAMVVLDAVGLLRSYR